MLAWQHVVLLLTRQHQIHVLHILRQRGALFPRAQMISPVRLCHLGIYDKMMKNTERRKRLLLKMFLDIFEEAWLPLAIYV